MVLFEGAGGSSIGLHAAGYHTVGFEFWPTAVECARANGLDARLHDLSDPANDDAVPYAPLWWASPPCQPFSAAGKGEGEFDDRDGFPWLFRLVGKRLPEVVITENVKGLTFAKHAAYFGAVLQSFRDLGYLVEWRVLNTANYGVPQTRERTIIVARRDGAPIIWPAPTHCRHGGMFTERWVTMADALGWGDDDALNPGRTEAQPNRRLYSSDEPAPTVAFGNDVGNWRRVMGKMMGSGMVERHGERPTRSLDEPAFTIRANGGGNASGGVIWLNYRQANEAGPILCDVTDRPWPHDRPATTIACDTRVFQPGGHHKPGEQSQNAVRLTIDELATLQGFPPDWQWTGTKTANAKMIGNAVPPKLAEVVAAANRPAEMRGAA